MSTQEETDRCVLATNAAMEVALEKCSDEAMLENLTRMMGLEETPTPSDVPDELDKPDCMEMELVRSWVAIRAHELIDDGEDVADAIAQAWAEASDQCGW